MYFACTFHIEDEQELIFSSSEGESSDVEGFDLDKMPLSFFAHGKFEAYCTLRNEMGDLYFKLRNGKSLLREMENLYFAK